MKKILSLIALVAMVATTATPSLFAVDVATQLQVDAGLLTIGNTHGPINFGPTSVSLTDQDLINYVDAGLYVSDLLSSDNGYYTTLQMESDMTGSNGGSIPAANIFVQLQSAGATPVQHYGTTGAVSTVFANVAHTLDAYVALDTPQTYLEREAGAYNGMVGFFDILLQFKVTIPAGTPIGLYNANMLYTLYDLSI